MYELPDELDLYLWQHLTFEDLVRLESTSASMRARLLRTNAWQWQLFWKLGGVDPKHFQSAAWWRTGSAAAGARSRTCAEAGGACCPEQPDCTMPGVLASLNHLTVLVTGQPVTPTLYKLALMARQASHELCGEQLRTDKRVLRARSLQLGIKMATAERRVSVQLLALQTQAHAATAAAHAIPELLAALEPGAPRPQDLGGGGDPYRRVLVTEFLKTLEGRDQHAAALERARAAVTERRARLLVSMEELARVQARRNRRRLLLSWLRLALMFPDSPRLTPDMREAARLWQSRHLALLRHWHTYAHLSDLVALSDARYSPMAKRSIDVWTGQAADPPDLPEGTLHRAMFEDAYASSCHSLQHAHALD